MVFSSSISVYTLKSMNSENTDLQIDSRLILTVVKDVENIASYDEIESKFISKT